MADIKSTLEERGKRYGAFKDQATLSQALQAVCQGVEKWIDMEECHREALTMICHKIARILNGDENYADNYHDIAGYATLVVDIIENAKAEKKKV